MPASIPLDIMNLALGELGQKPLVAQDLVDLKHTNAISCVREYAEVRRSLMRQFPFEFCTEELPLVPVDPAGLVIRLAYAGDVNGGYSFADDVFTHSVNDVVVSGESGAWLIGNAAGTEVYYTSTDAVVSPWDVSNWVVGAEGALPAPRIYPGTPRNYARLYALPTDCLRVLGVLNPASRQVDDKIRFKPFRVNWVACDLDAAVFSYVFDNAEVSDFDPLFVRAFVLGLAITLHPAVKGSSKDKRALMQEMSFALENAQVADASEGHEDPTQTMARRYIDV